MTLEQTRSPALEKRVTIGILTALPKEFAAMQVMLERPVRWTAPSGSRCKYRLGEITSVEGGSHVVALALLPDMGNNSASARATLLLEHFPNVEHLIMCGIAGGAPLHEKPEHDVRLGDVVVSDRGGVVQYDLRKEQPDGSTEHRHPPRPPGAALLEAMRHLEADALLGEHPWIEFLGRGETVKHATRPSDNVDAQGESIEYPHDPDRQPAVPRIFAGTVAAGNTLLKNTAHRDYLRETFGVKAVEMEGSGVADASWFNGRAGYLVVRGICDYCDERKGDVWQGSAAVAAAAYTRALLSSMARSTRVPPLGTSVHTNGSSCEKEPLSNVDKDLAEFLDLVFQIGELCALILLHASDAAESPTNATEAVAILRRHGAIRADLFQRVRRRLDVTSRTNPELERRSVELHAWLDELQSRQGLSLGEASPEGNTRSKEHRASTTPEERASTAPEESEPTAATPSYFTVVLDRTKQWEKFIKRCDRSAHDRIFVVHGKCDQDLHLFLDRVHLFHDHPDDGVGSRPHSLVIVDLDQGSRPSSAVEWTARTRQAIAAHLRRQVPKDLGAAISELCNASPALIILAGQGGGGLCSTARPGITPLTLAQGNGLVAFLRSLKGALAAKKKAHPVRMLIPVEYSDRARDQLFVTLQPHIQPPLFDLLAELTYPEWSEVEDSVNDFMAKHLAVYNPQVRSLCEEAYHECNADKTQRHFSALGRVLSAILCKYIEI